MNKKIVYPCLALVLFFVLTLPITASFAQKELEGPDDIQIDFIEGNSKRDLAVTFNHSSHTGYDCQSCHHKWEEDSGKDPRSCSTCHTDFSIEKESGYKWYFRIMHEKGLRYPTCVSCHIENFGDDQQMVGCSRSACHTDGIY